MPRVAPPTTASSLDGMRTTQGRGVWIIGALLFGLMSCDISGEAGQRATTASCIIEESELAGGCPGRGKDCVAALWNPELIAPDEAEYLNADSRVIGLTVDGQPYAVPLNVLWWHEVANFDAKETQLVVTYCPLTGSSLAFDRAAIGGQKFGVSGLLFKNNLVMYDSTRQESLWPQMSRAAGCGPRAGAALSMIPSIEMVWDGWVSLHPDTRVITGPNDPNQYERYPYGDYDELSNPRLSVPMEIDDRRPPKERVLGVPKSEGGIAFPFGELDNGAPVRAIAATRGRQEALVIFWDRARRAAMAYRPFIDGERLTFSVTDEHIRDNETGSTWRIDGEATAGPLRGRRLEPFAEAFVSFWFAWAAFQPDTQIWSGS